MTLATNHALSNYQISKERTILGRTPYIRFTKRKHDKDLLSTLLYISKVRIHMPFKFSRSYSRGMFKYPKK